MDGLNVDERVPYPEGTQDFVKCARQIGVTVEFVEPASDRRYVGFKAQEDWLPILEVARDLLIGIQGGLLVELLSSYLGPRESEGPPQDLTRGDELELEAPRTSEPPITKTLLHVDWRVVDESREDRFRADGDADAVLKALTKFEQSIRDAK